MRRILRPLFICVCFLLSQYLMLFLSVLLVRLVGGSADGYVLSVAGRSAVVVSGGLLVLFLATVMGMIRWRVVFRKPALSSVKVTLILVSSVLFLLGLNLLSERMALPDNNAELITAMAHHPIGVLTIAFFSPLVEELVFREAMIGDQIRQGGSAWWAILFSSLCFGLVHANPAQIPFATIMGVFLGYLYWKTGNVWLTCVIHVLNNGLALALLLIFGPDASLSELIGVGLPVCILSSFVCVSSLALIRRLL